jgi:hypothetical protein
LRLCSKIIIWFDNEKAVAEIEQLTQAVHPAYVAPAPPKPKNAPIFLSDTLRHLTSANVLPRCHYIVFAYFLELQIAPSSAARLALSAFPAMPIAFEFVEPLLSVCTACAVPYLTNGSSVAIVDTGFNLYVSVYTFEGIPT